ncbi:DUF962 domain-containing protein [Agarilytica rhodophyticola]|uniref:DUF962 domain-containing protein n=1 Tax=Agarilytica rhodophyticola TaxID=1737490 RepID=UPI000B349A71|nr:DUF962 domain-containing protein [Agarilytica rhodophyticola]
MNRYQSFNEFWPFYVHEHSKAHTRNMHFVGTLLSIIALLFALFYSFELILLAPLAGYSFAWISHFFIERNRPATFKYPFWSLMADYKMFFLMCRGQMEREVQRHT